MGKSDTNDPRVKRVVRIPRLPARRKDAHKGDFGRALIIGGSVGMSGAPALAGMAALRAGAGLVIVAVPRTIQPIVATLCPCATSIGLPETASGQIEPGSALRELIERGLAGPRAQAAPDALVIGMGMGRGDAHTARAVWELIDAFRSQAGVPCVIDADALNLARQGTDSAPEVWTTTEHPRTIITPHPGELARLRGVSTQEIQSAREPAAVETANTMARGTVDPEARPIVVLKGAGTIVTDGRRLYVNRTGNPGMATGGSGDVLGGVIGALLGQKLSLFDAAVLGVHVHGLAGDLAARQHGQSSLIATDIVEHLGTALHRAVASKTRGRR